MYSVGNIINKNAIWWQVCMVTIIARLMVIGLKCIEISFRKMVLMILHAGCKGDTDVKSKLLDSVGEGEVGMIWENSTETCTLSYVK